MHVLGMLTNGFYKLYSSNALTTESSSLKIALCIPENCIVMVWKNINSKAFIHTSVTNLHMYILNYDT